ncbi:restriction endonuclease subunit S [Avibacterium paragallinarum]|uniref:restriction endonuclease subunit S n=1 Tax=Avibacterium paragallinarum TaxID=728 RepID=UPI0021F72027|nr:restriction endonuclease subunit S [Avibacterium paragallinarum]UXN36716.1 restriction endonuclease subunit S [Avibacterium paragallinarum]
MFIYYQLNTTSKKKWAQTHANKAVSQASINQTTLSKQIVSTCFLPEQQKIGNLFKQLDRLITLHKRKLLEKYNKNNTKFLQNVTHQQSVLKLCCITFNPIIERTSLCN